MEQIKGWWFGTTDKKLTHNDKREIVIGKTHKLKGDIIPCRHGLHLSKNIIDALQYAPGPVIYRVIGSGIIIPHGNPIDKYACSKRTYVAGGIDISDTLRLFARKCALDVINLWEAPGIVIRYLKTGDESIMDAARAAAMAAAMDAAMNAAWGAVWAAARAAAMDAATNAARSAARAAARAAAWQGGGWDMKRIKQNKRLESMVSIVIGKENLKMRKGNGRSMEPEIDIIAYKEAIGFVVDTINGNIAKAREALDDFTEENLIVNAAQQEGYLLACMNLKDELIEWNKLFADNFSEADRTTKE